MYFIFKTIVAGNFICSMNWDTERQREVKERQRRIDRAERDGKIIVKLT